MATMSDVREVLASNADPAQKLDRLAALVFEATPEPLTPEPQSPPDAEPDAEPDAA